MRRTLSVLFWILLGALSTSAGLGYFLMEANHDRARLGQEAADARAELAQTKTANETLAAEANKKVQEAAAEVARAQQILQRSLEENRLIASAVPLVKPDAKTLKGWAEVASIPLGVSLRVPKTAQSQQTDRAFVIQTAPSKHSAPVEQWLTISPYQATVEEELRRSLQNAETVVYKVADRVIVGTKGTWSSVSGTTYLIRVQKPGGVATHLIWAKTLPGVDETQILQTLATFSFAS